MTPSIFPLVAADAGVTALLGTAPVRFWPFGQAPQNPAHPYAVWQVVGGSPENNLDCPPDVDRLTVQIDIYGGESAPAINAAVAIRNAIEPRAHVTSYRGQSREPETMLYRVSFDVSWFEFR